MRNLRSKLIANYRAEFETLQKLTFEQIQDKGILSNWHDFVESNEVPTYGQIIDSILFIIEELKTCSEADIEKYNY